MSKSKDVSDFDKCQIVIVGQLGQSIYRSYGVHFWLQSEPNGPRKNNWWTGNRASSKAHHCTTGANSSLNSPILQESYCSTVQNAHADKHPQPQWIWPVLAAQKDLHSISQMVFMLWLIGVNFNYYQLGLKKYFWYSNKFIPEKASALSLNLAGWIKGRDSEC